MMGISGAAEQTDLALSAISGGLKSPIQLIQYQRKKEKRKYKIMSLSLTVNHLIATCKFQ